MKKWISALTLLALLATGAAAATVENGNDSGTGSLRQALLDAKEGDTITVDNNVKSITVSSGRLILQEGVTLDGNGATLRGSSTRILEITSGTAKLNRLTFTGGNAANEHGGAVYISESGSAEFTNCTFFGNSAGAYGGAVCVNSSGSTTFQNCTLAGNSAANGGGVAVLKGTATFTASIVVGNSGGDLYRDSTSGIIGAGAYNVVGDTTGVDSASFSAAQGNHTGVEASSVLAASPLALETSENVQVLSLSSSTANPALDLIPKDTANMPDKDQRGKARPQLLGYDAGAFEATPVAVKSVTLQGAPYIQVGKQETYTLETTPANASRNKNYPEGVEWLGVSDTSVLSLSDGVVEALSPGSATLSAKFHGWDVDRGETTSNTVSLRIYVGEVPLPAPVVSIDAIEEQSVVVNETRSLVPTVRVSLAGYAAQMPYTLLASSSNSAVADVQVASDDSTLLITGKEVGSSDIALTVTSTNTAGTGRGERHFTLTVSESGGGGGGGCDAAGLGLAGLGALGLLAALRRR